MTDEPIPTGRAMDAWIAETIMGYQWVTSPTLRCLRHVLVPHLTAESLVRIYTPVVKMGRQGTPDLVDIDVVDLYHQDLRHAWRVVERITKPPMTVEATRRAWNTKFSALFQAANIWACSAEQAAMSICEMAWEAVHSPDIGA